MCRALKVICAAPDPEALLRLKRASTSSEWELVGGATSTEELLRQLRADGADVAVVDRALAGAVREAKGALPILRAVVVGDGPVEDADAHAATLDDVRPAIRSLPRRGPVR